MDSLSIRYNIQHVGDIVVDLLEKPVDLAQDFARGVALTYDIRELNKKRQDTLRKLGERMVRVAAGGPATVGSDEDLNALTAQLTEIERALDDKVREREEKVHISSCCTGHEGNTQGG